MKDILIFASSFIGINMLIFLPNWIIGIFSKIENSRRPFFGDSIFFMLKKILYQRYTDDCFRLLFEIQVFCLFLLLFDNMGYGFLKYLLLAIVMISFTYVTYINTIAKVFKKTPILINDLGFAKTGLVVYKRNLPVLVLIGIAILTVVLFLSSNLIDILFESSNNIHQTWPLIIVLLLSILLSIFSIIKIDYTEYHNSVSFSLIKHFIINLKKCDELNKSLKSLRADFPYDYVNKISLKEKPNVILIFLESYGSFTFSNEHYGEKLQKRLEELNKSILENDWSSMSCLSESPVASGGSWLSHSSVIFGAEVKDIAAHELIFGSTDYPSRLESLPKFLSSNGYKTTLTSSVSHEKNEVNWGKLRNSYPFDDIKLIDDFNYTGKKINTYGNRYTLPDEYTLNYSYTSHIDESPFFLCLSTTNSHYNFVAPLETPEHWQDYITKDYAVTDGLKKNNLKNYFTSIKYHFDYLDRFLTHENPDNTIVVLIGDHQPPLITPVNIDKATPIHIISKNKDFLSAFKEMGYKEGLIPSLKVNAKHESFFSKFLCALNKVYGTDKNLETPIFENGINLY